MDESTKRVRSKSPAVVGGKIVVDTLLSLGVKHVFGVPGGQTLAITDAIRASNEIRFIATRHEGAAACMADAVGRLTGRPGVCLATPGPGATNMLTGVGGAFRDSSPMIAITCNNRLADLDGDDAQAADHVSIFRPLVKWAKLVSSSRNIQQALEEGYTRATSGCPGPVLIDFARDVLEGPAESDRARWVRFPSREDLRMKERQPGDPARIERAAGLMRQSRRPTLWLGNGVKLAGAAAEALALAELAGMPVITTFNGIGAVPTSHPLVFGPLSRMGTQLSSRVLEETDLLIAVGNSFNAISTARWTLKMPETIVQIDIEPSIIGRYYSERTLGITGDAAAALSALTNEFTREPSPKETARARRSRLQTLTRAKDQWWKSAAQGVAARTGTIAPDSIIRLVRGEAPDDTIAVFDAGNPGVWSYLWEIKQAGTYLKPVGFGNMGFGVPAAIAAKIVRPDAPVVLFVGDGSLGMTLGELETVARERLAVLIIVMNDRGYGNIRQEQIVHYNGRTIGVDFTDVDYAAVARASGLDGERVTSEDALVKSVKRAFASRRPCVVEAIMDPDINAWTFPLFRHYQPGD